MSISRTQSFSYYNDGYDPYSNPSSSDQGWGDRYQAYAQQLYQYIAQMRSVLAQTFDGSTRTEIQNNLNLAYQYLEQIGADPTLGGTGWDPMNSGGYEYESYGMDPYGMGIPETASQNSSFPVSFQDSNHRVSDEGASSTVTIDQNDSDIRAIDFFQKDNTVMIPSNAASVTVTAQADDSVPGKTMIVVICRLSNGTTRRIVYHNADRENFKLNIQTPDVGQTLIDASLGSFAEKIFATEIGEGPEEEAIRGTPPDETTDTQRIWNTHDRVDYFATEGSTVDRIYADTVDIALPDRSHTAYVTKVGDHQYVIDIKDADGNVIRKIETFQTDHLNFSGVDAENLYVRDLSQNAGDMNIDGGIDWNGEIFFSPTSAPYKAWSDPEHDSLPGLTLGGEEEEISPPPAVNPDHPEDTAPTEINGETASFSTEETVSLHTSYEGPVTTYEITVPESLDLYPHDFNDEVKIERWGDEVRITFINSEGKEVVYKVKGPPARITLHALPQNVKVLTEDDPTLPASWTNFRDLEVSEVEEWFGNIEVPGSDAGTGEGTATETPPFLTTLMGLTGKTKEQVNAAILQIYPSLDSDGDGNLSEGELGSAQDSHVFPPRFPDGRFFHFLYNLDGELAGYLDQFAGGVARTRDAVMEPLRTRLVELLGNFYENVNPSGASNRNSDNLHLDGTEYDFIVREANGSRRGGWDNDPHHTDDPWKLLTLTHQGGSGNRGQVSGETD